MAKKHYLTAYPGGVGEGREGNMKKYKNLWGNTPKFRSFVVVTAILLNMRGRGDLLNKYKDWSFYGLENIEQIFSG